MTAPGALFLSDPFRLLGIIGFCILVLAGLACLGAFLWCRHGRDEDPLLVHAAHADLPEDAFRREQVRLEDAAAWTDAARRAAERDLDWEPDLKRVHDLLCRGFRYDDLLVRSHGPEFVRLYRRRARELCGRDVSRDGVAFSPWVADRMLKDAWETGRWQDLPDYLQGEYHERAEDGISWAGDWMTERIRAEAEAIYEQGRRPEAAGEDSGRSGP